MILVTVPPYTSPLNFISTNDHAIWIHDEMRNCRCILMKRVICTYHNDTWWNDCGDMYSVHVNCHIQWNEATSVSPSRDETTWNEATFHSVIIWWKWSVTIIIHGQWNVQKPEITGCLNSTRVPCEAVRCKGAPWPISLFLWAVFENVGHGD